MAKKGEKKLGGGFSVDRAARGELRGDALTIGTRGTYRAIFEEIKRILEPQLAVQGKWLSDRR